MNMKIDVSPITPPTGKKKTATRNGNSSHSTLVPYPVKADEDKQVPHQP